MNICAIMQPTYIPWVGYFDLIKNSTIFVIYDSVQFEKQSWQQRNRIRNKEGEILLTIPVKYDKGINRKINEVKIEKNKLFENQFKTIQSVYKKAINFNLYIDQIEIIYRNSSENLFEFNLELINFGMKIFKISTPLVLSSTLNVEGVKVDALIDICKKLNVDTYYSPIGSKSYIDENNIFEKEGIHLIYQNYSPPIYQQISYPDFISHLSFIDYIMNCQDLNIFNNK